MAERAPLDLAYLADIGAITKVSNRDYLTHPGLLRAAADHGLESIACEVVHADWQAGRFFMRATVTGTRGSYTGHGDANPDNVGRMIIPHAFRMAETRAVGRALRYYLGLGQTLQCELGGSEPKRARVEAPPVDERLLEAESWLHGVAQALGVSAGEVSDTLAAASRDWRDIPMDRREAAEAWLRGRLGAQA